jgi:hypothetical protein
MHKGGFAAVPGRLARVRDVTEQLSRGASDPLAIAAV